MLISVTVFILGSPAYKSGQTPQNGMADQGLHYFTFIPAVLVISTCSSSNLGQVQKKFNGPNTKVKCGIHVFIWIVHACSEMCECRKHWKSYVDVESTTKEWHTVFFSEKKDKDEFGVALLVYNFSDLSHRLQDCLNQIHHHLLNGSLFQNNFQEYAVETSHGGKTVEGLYEELQYIVDPVKRHSDSFIFSSLTMKWTLPSLQLETSIAAVRGFSQNTIAE